MTTEKPDLLDIAEKFEEQAKTADKETAKELRAAYHALNAAYHLQVAFAASAAAEDELADDEDAEEDEE
jgi:hypothetical protein